jgi:hypothetical protein
MGFIRRRASVLVCLALGGALGACGGGGGGGTAAPPPPTPTFSLNATSLTFTAASATAATPANQTVTGTVNNAAGTLSGTLYIVVSVTGQAVQTVSDFSTSGATGQASVSVHAPNTLGIGTYSSTITVHACLNSSTCASGELAGSPQTVNVSYKVNSLPVADSVQPHVVAAGTTGQVIIRGSGLRGTTSVAFGSTTATAFTVISDSQILATYPSVSAGSHSVSLTGSATTFTGSVVAVPPAGYASTTLSYPSPPAYVYVLDTVYDAQRQALYVAVTFDQSGNSVLTGNTLYRYAYMNGAWSSAQAIRIPNLRDIALSGDGSQLIALTSTAVIALDANMPDPATPISSVPVNLIGFPSSTYAKLIAFANDGNAVIATGNVGQIGDTDAVLYAPATASAAATFADLGSLNYLFSTFDTGSPELVAAADGSVVIATQQGAPVLQYSPTTGVLSATPIHVSGVSQVSGEPAALDRHGTKIVSYDGTTNNVYNGSFTFLGTLPVTAPATTLVIVVNPQGSRAFELNSDNTLHSFDLTGTPTNGGAFTEVGSGVVQQAPVASNQPALRTAVTPDGATIFIAGNQGVAVISAPP